jgi:hypothetical protein
MTASGFVEALVEHPDGLHVAGWMMLVDGAPDAVSLRGRDGWRVEAKTVQRPDLAQAFPHAHRAASAGFVAVVPAERFDGASTYDFALCALRGDEVAFRCRVQHRRANAAPLVGPMSIGDGVLYL